MNKEDRFRDKLQSEWKVCIRCAWWYKEARKDWSLSWCSPWWWAFYKRHDRRTIEKWDNYLIDNKHIWKK